MSLTRDRMVRCGESAHYEATITERRGLQKLSRHVKVTARPAIGPFSNYIREIIRIAMRKEKLEMRRKNFLEKVPSYQSSRI
jgi:hypothetical protein